MAVFGDVLDVAVLGYVVVVLGMAVFGLAVLCVVVLDEVYLLYLVM